MGWKRPQGPSVIRRRASFEDSPTDRLVPVCHSLLLEPSGSVDDRIHHRSVGDDGKPALRGSPDIRRNIYT